MVEIKAGQLKWCPCGFGFYVYGENVVYNHCGYSVYYRDGDGEVHELDPSRNIFVDPIAYEKAVIERITDMIVDVIRIEKHTYEDVGTVVEAHFDDFDNEESILISADPRPWESEYVIEVNHE